MTIISEIFSNSHTLGKNYDTTFLSFSHTSNEKKNSNTEIRKKCMHIYLKMV